MVEAMGVNGVEGMFPFSPFIPILLPITRIDDQVRTTDADNQVYSEKQRKSVYKSSERTLNPS